MFPLLFMFDLDGTLVESRADLAAATNRMRALHGLEPLPLDVVVSYVGDGVHALARRALQDAPVDPEQAAGEIGAAYAERLFDRTRPYPGVDDGLRALRAAGHVLALVTNKPAPHARRIVDHFGWSDLFALVVAGGDSPELKPSPLPLRLAMQRTGHAPENSWMVGEHHPDLAAARRAGARSVLVESGFGHAGAETPDLAFPDFASFARHFLHSPHDAPRA